MSIVILILIGLLAGVLSGLMGVGGGVLIVPALIYLVKIPQLTAQGTSLVLFMLPLSIFAVVKYYNTGHIDFHIAILLALGFILGSVLGSQIAFIVDAQVLSKILAIVLFLVAIRLFFN